MSELTKEEINKLSVMYEGDRKRDASSKIRGFLFQDYITIMCLLQDQVKYVCSEYLEDVDVFFENGTFEFIQVKYYPNSNPGMKEILTDLYYQYLRFQMLHSDLDAVPSLYIHISKNTKAEKPTLDEMKKYIEIENELPRSVPDLKTEDTVAWLKENVYTTNRKEEQKNKLFGKMASKDSLEEFIAKYCISRKSDINQYKGELLTALARTYPNPGKGGDEERWQLILLGLAITYIQNRYTTDDTDFEKLRIDKKEFDRYMLAFPKMKTEQMIANYLVGVACEEYGEIINHNDLSDLQLHMLNRIYQNTIKWINKICENENGQYQILNTFSSDDMSKVNMYKNVTADERFIYIVECKSAFIVFLDYLWKIMLNICQERGIDEKQFPDNLNLFNPTSYMDESIEEYVCLNFPQDKCVNRSVILPPANRKFNSIKRRIVERMVKTSVKPQKWFFQNDDIMKGKNYYNYSTTNVNENPTVADLGGEDTFYIECMECIEIDEDKWRKREDCGSCIFSEKCVKEEKQL